MKTIRALSALLLSLFFVNSNAQINARLFRYPDVSKTDITFTYAGDIWIVSKQGGTANRLSSPEGEEMFPKFSPDGSKIAFTGNYDGNSDVYVMPVQGGIPERLTYHGSMDMVVDWHPDGSHVMFASGREAGRQRFNQLFLIPDGGGMSEKLPMAIAEFGTFSPDGKEIVFTQSSRLFRTWKRYRGGRAADIYTFNLSSYNSKNITANDANDELPMWHSGNTIFYLSDQGPELRANIWEYDLSEETSRQITFFKDFDVHFPSLGPDDIVFEAGGKLYLYNIEAANYHEVSVQVKTDQVTIAPVTKKAENYVQNMQISPDGNRAVVEARGELFSLPAENGYVKNLTRTSGIAERFPAWSPDGKYIAYWSDRSGENELTLLDMNEGTEKKLTDYGPGYRYNLFWSPDSKKLAFVDQKMDIQYYDIEKNTTTKIDKGLRLFQGGLASFEVSWSSDSRWIAYSRIAHLYNRAIFVFDTESKQLNQVTSGFYSDGSPVFSEDMEYLFLVTTRELSPVYGNFDYSFVYPNAERLAAIPLRKDVKSLLQPENDEVSLKEADKKDENGEEGEKDNKDKKKKDKKEDKDAGEKSEDKGVLIDFEGMEQRMILLPPEAGNFGDIRAVEGKLIFSKFPNAGSSDNNSSIDYYDLKEKEVKTIIEGVGGFEVSADGKKMLVASRGSAAIIDIKPGQKMEKRLPLGDMEMMVDPRSEWKQIFNDAWRLERDFFYDPNMHGVDWDAMRTQYGAMVDDAMNREDLNFILGELIGELNSSHTYKGGGDLDRPDRRNVGYLGINWEADGSLYRIGEIIRGAVWDAEARSPFDQPGMDVKKGEYIFEVNGIPITTDREPYAAFQGLGDKTVELLIGTSSDKKDARKVVVELMNDETRLRHLAWIESNRKQVDQATEGKIGYIYVRSTGIDGQNELVRQFAGQLHKEGLIIDERFNSGGQIPERFIEILNRKPLAFWKTRDGITWQTPNYGNFGPKVMLINGWSGSGGDAFPDYFRKAGLGPLVGTRTWGGLIGMSGIPSLIDGGSVSVPTFRMFDPDGKWFMEGHGVDPDIDVPEDPTELARGKDAQLDTAIDWINKALTKPEYKRTEPQQIEDR